MPSHARRPPPVNAARISPGHANLAAKRAAALNLAAGDSVIARLLAAADSPTLPAHRGTGNDDVVTTCTVAPSTPAATSVDELRHEQRLQSREKQMNRILEYIMYTQPVAVTNFPKLCAVIAMFGGSPSKGARPLKRPKVVFEAAAHLRHSTRISLFQDPSPDGTDIMLQHAAKPEPVERLNVKTESSPTLRYKCDLCLLCPLVIVCSFEASAHMHWPNVFVYWHRLALSDGDKLCSATFQTGLNAFAASQRHGDVIKVTNYVLVELTEGQFSGRAHLIILDATRVSAEDTVQPSTARGMESLEFMPGLQLVRLELGHFECAGYWLLVCC